VPGFVDPRPAQEAALRDLQDRLAATVDDDERTRLQEEISHLEHALGRGHWVRRFFLGSGHRSVRW
jgi:hypothetical protein